jgi:SET domain-containing protein
MLFVKTEVRPSAIQGLGLFAAESIAAGTLIARFDPAFGWSCTEEQWAALPPLAREHMLRYAWRTGDGRWLMDVDDSRYMNHSTAPNMQVSAEHGFTAVAARDIAAGEELTEDYSLFDPDFATYAAGWSTT